MKAWLGGIVRGAARAYEGGGISFVSWEEEEASARDDDDRAAAEERGCPLTARRKEKRSL